jgi:hypothetical protein
VRAGAIIALGPEMTHSGELPLDPLTLELYLPRGEASTVIHDEDRPDIPVHYVRQADSLTVEVGPSPGVVEIVLYGLAANAALMNGQSLDLGEKPGGLFVRFDGSAGARVEVGLVR